MAVGFGFHDDERPETYKGIFLAWLVSPIVKFLGENKILRLKHWRGQLKTVPLHFWHLRRLWKVSYRCRNCCEYFLLGDTELTTLEAPKGWTRTALVRCLSCGCTPDRNPIFNFKTGKFEGGYAQFKTDYSQKLPDGWEEKYKKELDPGYRNLPQRERMNDSRRRS